MDFEHIILEEEQKDLFIRIVEKYLFISPFTKTYSKV